jgi:hypothetical protein
MSNASGGGQPFLTAYQFVEVERDIIGEVDKRRPSVDRLKHSRLEHPTCLDSRRALTATRWVATALPGELIAILSNDRLQYVYATLSSSRVLAHGGTDLGNYRKPGNRARCFRPVVAPETDLVSISCCSRCKERRHL